jgi:DNA-binding transcriptional regulator YiaG
MTTKTKSRILEAVHDSASDLHRLGFIDKRKMQKYDALCLEPGQDYDAAKVKALRERLHLSQAVLASVLNESWPVATGACGRSGSRGQNSRPGRELGGGVRRGGRSARKVGWSSLSPWKVRMETATDRGEGGEAAAL